MTEGVLLSLFVCEKSLLLEEKVPQCSHLGRMRCCMNNTANSLLRPYAQKLRREMTKEERHLWYDFLRSQPMTFHRQKVIGPYIVDFYCAGAKLVIELDGSQHYEKAGIEEDFTRDRYLQETGLCVLRYSNADVNQHFEQVCEDNLNHIESRCG